MMKDPAAKPRAATSVASPQVASGRHLHAENVTLTHEECPRSAQEHDSAVNAASVNPGLDGNVRKNDPCGSVPSSVIHFAAGAVSSFLLSWGIIRAMSGLSGAGTLAAASSVVELNAVRAEIQLLAEKVAQLAPGAAPIVATAHGVQDTLQILSAGALAMLIGAAFCFVALQERSSMGNAKPTESASMQSCEMLTAMEHKLKLLFEGLHGLQSQRRIECSSNDSIAQDTGSDTQSPGQAGESGIVQPIDLTWKLEEDQSQVCARMRFIHRVEWDVSGKDFASFKWGEFLESSEFRLGTHHGLRMRFIPRGGAADGCCRLALVAPHRLSELECRLYVDGRSEMGCLAECGETTYMWAQIPADAKQLYNVIAVEFLKPEGLTTL